MLQIVETTNHYWHTAFEWFIITIVGLKVAFMILLQITGSIDWDNFKFKLFKKHYEKFIKRKKDA